LIRQTVETARWATGRLAGHRCRSPT